MTLDEIMALQPGQKTDDLTAEALHWKKVIIRLRAKKGDDDRPGRVKKTITGWSDGKNVITGWEPSRNWEDTGKLGEIVSANPLNVVQLSLGGETPGAVIEATDYLGPGGTQLVYFRAAGKDTKLALCKAFLRMANGHYETS